MPKQFVDHFKVKDLGFNFFPALGYILGILLGQIIMFLYFFQSNWIRKNDINYEPSSSVIFFAVLYACFLIVSLHLARTDLEFLLVFGLGGIVIGLLVRLIHLLIFNYPPDFYQGGRFLGTVFDVRFLVGSLIFGAATAGALILFHQVFKRLDLALILGFPAGSLVVQFYYRIIGLASGSKLEFSDVEFIGLDLVESALCGFLFYAGYDIFMRSKGWRPSKLGYAPAGEDTAPRSDLVSRKLTLGILLTTALFNIALFGLVLAKMNLQRFQFYGPAAFPPVLIRWVDVVFMPVLVVAALLSLASAAVFLLFIYRSWTALQDGRATTSPLSAVLLLFVPVFNLYWMTQLLYGFARDHNSLADRHRLNVPRLPSWLYLVSGIMGLVVTGAVIAFSIFVDPADSQNYSSLISLLVFPSFIQTALVLAVVHLTGQAVNRIPPEIYGAGSAAVKRPA